MSPGRHDGAGIARRDFLRGGIAALGVGASGAAAFAASDVQPAPLVRFGLVADLHYADIDPMKEGKSARHYRESLAKLTEAVETFNWRRPDFVVELGDFKDMTRDRDATLAALDRIEAAFAKFKGLRYHVAGNHDFDCLSPEEFFSRTLNGGKVCGKGYHSFICNGVTFIVLDGCYTSDMKHYCRANPWMDANIPPDEMEWFGRELSGAKGHAIVLCHQRLDPAAERRHLVKNAADVRSLLERSGKVRAVVTGHQHTGGSSVVNGIPYYTLAAMVTGTGPMANCYAEAALYPSGAFTVTGFGRARPFQAQGGKELQT